MKSLLSKKNNFLYLSLLALVFIASSALALSGSDFVVKIVNQEQPKSFSLLPTLVENASFPVVSAQAALAVDLTSGVTLYEKDPDKPLLPASTTKIVTALVAMDAYPEEAVLEVKDIKVEGQKMGLRKGEKIKVSGLLYGLLIYSANDAAEVLAANFSTSPASGPGGREAFVIAMNQKAKELHLNNSNFTNPTGLDTDGDHIVSTARDLIRISEVAMQNSRFSDIVRTKEITVKSFDGKIAHRLTNINELIGKVPGVLGVKTGWTENARENLITYIERDGHKVMIAVLGSQDRFGETKELIDWIFSNYEWQEVKLPQSP